MDLTLVTTPLPLKKDKHGVIRIADTRIPLETVIIAFKNGATCEEIVYQFTSLDLADVYATISYYLKHQDEVESYLKERQRKAKQIRKQIESHFDSKGIREGLLKRRVKTNG